MMKLCDYLVIRFLGAPAASVGLVIPAKAGIQSMDNTKMAC
jgi:hypothetical protein